MLIVLRKFLSGLVGARPPDAGRKEAILVAEFDSGDLGRDGFGLDGVRSFGEDFTGEGALEEFEGIGNVFRDFAVGSGGRAPIGAFAAGCEGIDAIPRSIASSGMAPFQNESERANVDLLAIRVVATSQSMGLRFETQGYASGFGVNLAQGQDHLNARSILVQLWKTKEPWACSLNELARIYCHYFS